MNLSAILKYVALVCVFLGFILSFWYFFDCGFIQFTGHWDSKKMPDIQPFMSSFVAPLFSLAGFLFLFVNLWQTRVTQFDNNFFKLLDNHHKILNTIEDTISGLYQEKKASAKTAFFDDLAFRIAVDFGGAPVETNEPLSTSNDLTCSTADKQNFTITPICLGAKNLTGKQRLCFIYGYYFHIHHSSLAHYFRNLYYIVSYIDSSGMPDKKRYMGILRAQLSNYELLLLAYNCMYDFGSEKFKPLVEKYQLLKNLNFEIGLNSEYIQRIIPEHSLLTNEYKHLEKTLAEQHHIAKQYQINDSACAEAA